MCSCLLFAVLTRIWASFAAFSFRFRIATRFAATVTALSLRSETAGAPSTSAVPMSTSIQALLSSLPAPSPASAFPSLGLPVKAGRDDSLIPRTYADSFRLGWAWSLRTMGLVVGRPSLPIVAAPSPPPPATLGFAALPADDPSGIRFAALSSADLRRLFSALLRNICSLRARTWPPEGSAMTSSVFVGDRRYCTGGALTVEISGARQNLKR